MKAVVITCEKYHNSRVLKIDESWGNKIDVIYLSDINDGIKFIGYPELEKGYSNIWKKYVEFFKKYEFNDEFYLFCDDDTFVNMKNINSLNISNDIPVCVGIIGTLNKDATDKDGNNTGFPLYTIIGKDIELPVNYPSGGAGFILNKKAIINIKNYLSSIGSEDIPRSHNGDVTIGFWLRNSGINLVNQHGFWWTNPKELKHEIEDINKSYTYHYVDEDMMIELYKKIEN
jgi:hypothetical protein